MVMPSMLPSPVLGTKVVLAPVTGSNDLMGALVPQKTTTNRCPTGSQTIPLGVPAVFDTSVVWALFATSTL